MTSTTYLYKVNQTYYFRCRIPSDLKGYFEGKEDFKRSLKTKSLTIARSYLKLWGAKTEKTFMLMRSGALTPEQIRKLAEEWKHAALDNSPTNNRLLWHDYPHGRAELHSRLEVEKIVEQQAKDALIFNTFNGIQSSIVDSVIKECGLDVSKASPEYIILARELMQKLIEVCQIEQQRMVGNYQNGYDDAPTVIFSPHHSSLPPTTPPKRMLSEAIDRYISDVANKGRASAYSIKEYTGCCGLFLRVMGDIELGSITRDSIRQFHDTLKRLPSNMNKIAAYRGKTVPQLLEMDIPESKRLSASSVKKYSDKVYGLCAWSVQEGWIEQNPSEGLKQTKKKKNKASEERNAYDREDLQRMVDGFHRVAAKGKLKGKPERLWLPLIALYSGLRLNEIAQLHVEDIRQDGNTWCFSIAGDASTGSKRVKTVSSERLVPIHPALTTMGFLEYFQGVKDTGSPRLWMNLKQSKSRDKYDRNFSNWFLGNGSNKGFNYNYITKDPKRVFHSFRHTFINELKQRLVDENVLGEIVGHSSGSITLERYGKPYALNTRLEAMLKLDYGIDIAGLKGIISAG